MELVQNIWHGKIGLAKAYWVYSVLVGFILSLVSSLLFKSSQLDLLGSTFLVFIFFAFASIYGMVVAVGVWNSATLYKGNFIWAILAKVHTVISLIFIVFGLLAIGSNFPVVTFACFVLLFFVAIILRASKPNSELSKREFDSATPTQQSSQKFYKTEHQNSSKGRTEEIPQNVINGSEDWNLAIKYDSDLLATYRSIYEINPAYAEQFKHTVTELKIFANYQDVAAKILGEAMGTSSSKGKYSENDLVNEIANILIKKNGKAAKEFLELIKLYSLESNVNDQTVEKILSIVNKIEDVYGISIMGEVTSLNASSSSFEIRFGLYQKIEYQGISILHLKNGYGAVERSSQYRIYNSLEAAQSAANLYSSQNLWTNKDIVETIDRNS
ncbi:hypothetical protein G6675_06095 [Polynucleobacter paneuropaeus]|nr:hypothetical protein [Polynucleobacter paneuropaeus]MBT8600510.1 hypothetical protein [Polynucleobacter paneuropaeus]